MKCKWFSVCPLRVFEEQGKLSSKFRKKFCEGNWKDCARYQMEEKGISHKANLMPDGTEIRL